MSYRPQFVYEAPDGFRDEQFSYSFDFSNTPGLSLPVPANGTLRNIQLELQSDAAFMLRALRVQSSVLTFQIYQGTFGDLVENDFCLIDLTFGASGTVPVIGGLPVPLTEELPCRAGGNIVVNLTNPTGAPVACPEITLLGVKRFKQ